jgi:hypothetical protein
LILHKLRFHPDFVASFSPPCEGGVRGGGPGTTSHKVFPCSLPLSPFASLSRGEKNRLRFPRLSHHPPCPPLRKGGKGIARSRRHSIARNKNTRLEHRPSNSVNTNFSPAQPRPPARMKRPWGELVLHGNLSCSRVYNGCHSSFDKLLLAKNERRTMGAYVGQMSGQPINITLTGARLFLSP